MMLSCQEATELASRSLDTPLPWRARLALRLHLALCKGCRRYLRQLRLVQRLVHTARRGDWLPKAHLSAEARRRILDHFRRGE